MEYGDDLGIASSVSIFLAGVSCIWSGKYIETFKLFAASYDKSVES